MFEINKVAYDENNTEKVQNLSFKLLNDNQHLKFLLYYLRVTGNSKEFRPTDPVKIFKHVFGKQLQTVVYAKKHRIWTFSNGKAVIHCLISTEGLSLEYNPAISKEKAVHPLCREIFKAIKESI